MFSVFINSKKSKYWLKYCAPIFALNFVPEPIFLDIYTELSFYLKILEVSRGAVYRPTSGVDGGGDVRSLLCRK